MTAAQAGLVGIFLDTADYRESVQQVIDEEIQELKDKVRQHVKAREFDRAAHTEAQITILEEFFQILERRTQYQSPAQM